MAKILLGTENDLNSYLEIRPWASTGTDKQVFALGSGVNFDARWTYLVEVLHVLNGLPVFYIRHFISQINGLSATQFEPFWSGKQDQAGFFDMFPETGFEIVRKKYPAGPDKDGEEQSSYKFRLWLDTGILFARQCEKANGIPIFNLDPSTIEIVLDFANPDRLRRFTDDFTAEMLAIQAGKHPDPRLFPAELSRWPAIRTLTAQAYDEISTTYQDEYFQNEKLNAAFQEWLGLLPPAARVLDIGCGHGNPVIGRLLESGCRVTGMDISARMLAKAREQYPQAETLNLAATDLTDEAQYDAACSFSSLLYLDPIDLRFSLDRIHHALKDGGLLFLYSFDSHPEWAGMPYREVIHQYMWSWNNSLEETITALEEYGLFEVIRSGDATTPEEKERAIQDIARHSEPAPEPFEFEIEGHQVVLPPFPELPRAEAYGFVVIARKK